MKNKKLNILLFGYNGVNNTGSEAKLLTTIIDLKEVLKERVGKIGIVTQSAEKQRRYVKDENIEMVEVGSITIFLNPKILITCDYDILILNEGSTFIDHFSSAFILMFCVQAIEAKLKGMKVVSYANDCGHLKPLNQKLLRFTLNNFVDLIMLRNPDAIKRMKEYGVKKEIYLTADGAYEYPLPSKEYRDNLLKKLELNPDEKPMVGIAPKEFFWWPVTPKLYGKKEDCYRYPFYHSWAEVGKESSKRYTEQTARYADWCVEKFNANIAIIAMEHMDYPPSKRIYDSMKHKDRARLIASDEYIVDDIVSILSVLKFQVTTRYHTTVLASPHGVPMTSVSSDTRCEAVFKELEMMDYYLNYVEHPSPIPKIENLFEWCKDVTENLIKNEDEIKNRILKFHPIFYERCRKNREIFKEWLEKIFLENIK